MKKTILVFALSVFSAGWVNAQHGGTGVGVIVGEPTGISVKHWIDERSAIDGAIGWSFDGPTSFHLHADWLWHDFELIPVERGALPVYYGVGARFKAGRENRPGRGDRGKDRLGVRIPVGIAYHFDQAPIEVFGELVPILDLAPSTKLNLNAAVGVRWYFR